MARRPPATRRVMIGRSWRAASIMLATVMGVIIAAGCATSPAGSSAGAAAPGTSPANATSTTATGPIPVYRLDPTHTFVHWEIVHMGTSTIRGRFDTATTGSVQFDPVGKRLEVSISIDTASVDSGVKKLDGLLKGPELLSTEAYPQAYFVAHQARFDGDALREVRGEFTLRGVSQPLSLRSTRWNCALSPVFRRTVCGGDFEAEIVRSDYGISYGLPFVADKVRLLIQVEAIAP